MTQTIILRQHNRHAAHRLIDAAPDGYVCKIGEAKRSTDQNSKLWAMLSDVSRAMPEGRRLTPEDWKCVFMNACGWDVQFLDGLDGKPFPSGFRSSRMTKSQMADLITFIQAKGDEWGVQWTDEPTVAG